MSKPRELDVSKEDRITLQRWTRGRKTDNATAMPARIILMTREGKPADGVADTLGVSARSVYKWIWRFSKEGLEGLAERQRSGRPRALDHDAMMEILSKTMEELREGSTHWNVRTIAVAAKVTKHQVGQVLASAGLKPHRVKSFRISPRPEVRREGRWRCQPVHEPARERLGLVG